MTTSQDRQRKMFEELASSSIPEDRLKAAKSLRCPPDILIQLTKDRSPFSEISRKAWSNPKLPKDRMKQGAVKLATGGYGNWGVYGLVYNKNLPAELCVKISQRIPSIYQHPNFPIKVMLEQYKQANLNAKKYMAKNQNLSQEMQYLLRQEPAKVKCALAKNKNISQKTVDYLAASNSPPVLRTIIDHPLAKIHKETILLKLSACNVMQGIHTTAAIARHTSNQEFVKEVLEKTDHPVIQKSIFTNQSLDETLIEQACYSEKKDIRNMAAKHPKCPETGKVVAALMDE